MAYWLRKFCSGFERISSFFWGRGLGDNRKKFVL
jgi:hypothetical protein